MLLTVKELAGSRNFTTQATGATMSVEVVVFPTSPGGGLPTELEVYRAAYAFAPLTYLGMGKLEVDGTPQGGGVWLASVKYARPEGQQNSAPAVGSPPPPPAPADTDPLIDVSVDIVGVPTHITRSLKTISKTGLDGAAAPNFRRGINVTPEGVQGLDIDTGAMDFTVTRIFPEGVTLQYMRQVRDLFDGVNNAAWWNFPAGEVRFRGAAFSPHKSGEGAAGAVGVFKFSTLKNKVDIVVVGAADAVATGITVPAKKGWEYLWVNYTESIDAGRKVESALAAYVEQIYPEVAFVGLGIG